MKKTMYPWSLAVLSGLLCVGGLYVIARAAKGEKEKPLPKKFGEGSRDIIEEASWESFPASDPPSYGR